MAFNPNNIYIETLKSKSDIISSMVDHGFSPDEATFFTSKFIDLCRQDFINHLESEEDNE